MGRLIFLLFLGLSHLQVHQCLRFHSYFADGMVLQHNVPNKIWGFDALDEVHASITCVAKNGIELSEKLFGVVWICSGQSNMEQNMGNIMNSTEEIENSAKYN